MNAGAEDRNMTESGGGMDLFSGLDGEHSNKRMGGASLQMLPTCSDNPLVRAAVRLLNLIVQLRMTTAMPDITQLRQSLVDEIRFFEAQALAGNVARDEIIGARYCLCTALDEAAGQTPWGGNGAWARHSLLVAFHNETWGGEKYYQLLARLAQNPQRHHALIELLYYCNMLGFEGRFRIAENGHAQLEILKRRIATLLHSAEGYEQRLSSHWRGVEMRREIWRMVPPWVVAAACALLAFAVYVGLRFTLAAASDPVFVRLSALKPPSIVVDEPLLRSTPPRLQRFLEPEIRAGLLEVRDLPDRSIVILKGDGLFASGSIDIRANYLDVLTRVARALDETDGSVLVTGYTDNVAIRSVRFPSNWELSQARAQAVAQLLAGHMRDFERVRAEGRGEANPIAANNTQEGRARNRRVEIILMLSGEEILRQLNPIPGTQATEARL